MKITTILSAVTLIIFTVLPWAFLIAAPIFMFLLMIALLPWLAFYFFRNFWNQKSLAILHQQISTFTLLLLREVPETRQLCYCTGIAHGQQYFGLYIQGELFRSGQYGHTPTWGGLLHRTLVSSPLPYFLHNNIRHRLPRHTRRIDRKNKCPNGKCPLLKQCPNRVQIVKTHVPLQFATESGSMPDQSQFKIQSQQIISFPAA